MSERDELLTVARAIEEFEPDTVINCAAFHNVDLCEREEEMAFRINGVAVKRHLVLPVTGKEVRNQR